LNADIHLAEQRSEVEVESFEVDGSESRNAELPKGGGNEKRE